MQTVAYSCRRQRPGVHCAVRTTQEVYDLLIRDDERRLNAGAFKQNRRDSTSRETKTVPRYNTSRVGKETVPRQ